jgi:hypothetical protein
MSHDTDVQIRIPGRVKENAVGGETISFTFQVVCIANIPTDEQGDRAPVYVKITPIVRRDHPSQGN